jgi:hypothetical protein
VHAVARIAVVALTACSLNTVEAPPARFPDRGGIRCTEHSSAPYVDVAIALITAVGAGFAADYIWHSLTAPPSGQCNGCGIFILPFAGAVTALPFIVPGVFAGSAFSGAQRETWCRDAKAAMRAKGRDPDAPVDGPLPPPWPFDHQPKTPGEVMAHDGERAAERGDCDVVRAIADQLRTMNEPATLDRYLHNTGVAQCVP